jgi:hypothetical protein
MTIGEQSTKVKTVVSVAFILERERDSTIKEWLKRVNLVADLTNIPLSDANRTGHLPKLFDDLLSRLRRGRDAQPVHFHRRSRARQRPVRAGLLSFYAS